MRWWFWQGQDRSCCTPSAPLASTSTIGTATSISTAELFLFLSPRSVPRQGKAEDVLTCVPKEIQTRTAIGDASCSRRVRLLHNGLSACNNGNKTSASHCWRRYLWFRKIPSNSEVLFRCRIVMMRCDDAAADESRAIHGRASSYTTAAAEGIKDVYDRSST